MIIAMFVTFFSFALLFTHVSKSTMRRIVGYKGWVDLLLHGTVLYIFLGTSTNGLLQAEAAAILFSLYLRGYSYLLGYERLSKGKWQRYAGRLT